MFSGNLSKGPGTVETMAHRSALAVECRCTAGPAVVATVDLPGKWWETMGLLLYNPNMMYVYLFWDSIYNIYNMVYVYMIVYIYCFYMFLPIYVSNVSIQPINDMPTDDISISLMGIGPS